ncbi:MAG: AbrB/MazE/SpoVT family DNA-binding domain-containing protein [Lachnospiraceae bacterium]|nr:AbrB/MazE/SpoVT family DNA-binding domain-containing protein [Lachnospiraceae bacterium]
MTQWDDLGRVVVPKEIRRTLRIREGDPLEIYTDREGEIILKKYSPIGELSAFAEQYAESLAQTMGGLVCVSDRDHIIAAAGSGKKDYNGKQISRQLESVIQNRVHRVTDRNDSNFVRITTDDRADYQTQAISTIISDGDAVGAVILCSADSLEKSGGAQEKLVQTAAGFLGRQMES